jgi:hypothetical protein
MFKITSTRAITWPDLSLRKGENEFTSRKAVPPLLWPKLERFRELGLLSFEGEAKAGDDTVKLEELSQRQLYAMSKAELADLAKTAGVAGLADGTSKATLIGELEKRLSPGAIATAPPAEPGEQPGVTVDPTGGEKVVIANRRGRGPAPASNEG